MHAVLEQDSGYAAPQPDIETGIPPSLFTCDTDPFQAVCVAKILELVQIGRDLSAGECTEVLELIASYADILALFIGEVRAMALGVHHLDIKQGVNFSTKIQYRWVMPSTQTNLDRTLNSLLAASILQPLAAKEVKCCSPVKMVQKLHSNQGLSVTELQHQVNEQCIHSGMTPRFDILPREDPSAIPQVWDNNPKW